MLPLWRPQWTKAAAIPVAASARPATNRHDPVLGFNISTDGVVAPAMSLGPMFADERLSLSAERTRPRLFELRPTLGTGGRPSPGHPVIVK
jgi:hypothetical protein